MRAKNGLPIVEWTFPSKREASLLSTRVLEEHYVVAKYNKRAKDADRIGRVLDERRHKVARRSDPKPPAVKSIPLRTFLREVLKIQAVREAFEARGRQIRQSAGAAIRTSRERGGMTRAQLARRVGVRPATVASWETARRQPSSEARLRLMKTLGLTGRQLSGYEPTRARDT